MWRSSILEWIFKLCVCGHSPQFSFSQIHYYWVLLSWVLQLSKTLNLLRFVLNHLLIMYLQSLIMFFFYQLKLERRLESEGSKRTQDWAGTTVRETREGTGLCTGFSWRKDYLHSILTLTQRYFFQGQDCF